MARYRISFDVIEKESGITATQLLEIRNEAMRAAKLELPPGTTRIKVVPDANERGFHVHFGGEGCSECASKIANDGLGQDTDSAFQTLLSQ